MEPNARRCPVCGAPLTSEDLGAGRCPTCGATVLGLSAGDPAATLTPGAPVTPATLGDASPEDAGAATGPMDPLETRLTPREWLEVAQFDVATPPPIESPLGTSLVGLVIGLLVAMLLVVACGFGVVSVLARQTTLVPAGASSVSVARTPSVTVATTANPGGVLTFPTQGANPTPLPFLYPTPTLPPSPTPTVDPNATATPANGAPTATPNPNPNPNPNPTPGGDAPPALAVSPTAVLVACGRNTGVTRVVVSNSGGGTLVWRAAPSPGSPDYRLSPTGGALAPGAATTLYISNVVRRGGVIISADNADNSPQAVAISCLN